MVPSSVNWVLQLLFLEIICSRTLGYYYLFSAGEGNVFPTMYDFILNSQPPNHHLPAANSFRLLHRSIPEYHKLSEALHHN